MKYYDYIFVLLLFFLIALIKYIKNRTKCIIPHNNFFMTYPDVIHRFETLVKLWQNIANDEQFCIFAHHLMDTNANIQNANIGDLQLALVYKKLHHYINSKNKKLRITLIYTDGIVFYDSLLPMNKVYYMVNGLPRQVSMATTGSPLKNHNTLPEITNSIILNDASNACLDGLAPIYSYMLKNGFGFYERMSSSIDKPFTYVAKFLTLPYPKNGSSYTDGCTLRIGVLINSTHNKML